MVAVLVELGPLPANALRGQKAIGAVGVSPLQSSAVQDAFSLASLDKKLPSFRGAGTSARQRRGQL